MDAPIMWTDELGTLIRLKQRHESVVDRHRDVEVAQRSDGVLAVNELEDVWVVDAERAEIRAAHLPAGHDGGGLSVEQRQPGDRATGAGRLAAGDRRATLPYRREVEAGPAALPMASRRERQRVKNRLKVVLQRQ